MNDFLEIDFLKIDSDSGDAICGRYCINDKTHIHLIDGGSYETGELISNHIKEFYNCDKIDNIIVTHNDRNHTDGLEIVLNKFNVGTLWMNRPWDFADEIIEKSFPLMTKGQLISNLKRDFDNLTKLEGIAQRLNIPIKCALQDSKIGEFYVMSPSKQRFIDLVTKIEMKKLEQSSNYHETLDNGIQNVTTQVVGVWGEENFPIDYNTSEMNEMSIVQFANLCNENILLTSDVGKIGLNDAIEFAEKKFQEVPKLDFFQVPHHGSSCNVSPEILNKWLGAKLSSQSQKRDRPFSAYISVSMNDEINPDKSVVRSIIHRGGNVFTTEDCSLQHHVNAPNRIYWEVAKSLEYPN